MYHIQIKRIYAAYAPADGYRVLVDRLWPRGIRKTEANLDTWARNISPSTELRKSFAHQPERFAAFQKAYTDELDENPEALEFARACKEILISRDITFLYAAKDEARDNAVVLREWIRKQIEQPDSQA